MWTSLNTATLKFSAIYNAIERNPPSGSGPEDWLRTSHTIYQDQSKGAPFNSIAAWYKVRLAPKWQPNKPNKIIPTFSLDPIEGLPDSSVTASGLCTPSACSSGPLARPIGQKAAKRRQTKGNKDEEKLARASVFTEVARERLASLNKAASIFEAKNALSENA